MLRVSISPVLATFIEARQQSHALSVNYLFFQVFRDRPAHKVSEATCREIRGSGIRQTRVFAVLIRSNIELAVRSQFCLRSHLIPLAAHGIRVEPDLSPYLIHYFSETRWVAINDVEEVT